MSPPRLPSSELIVWDCPTCGATGCEDIVGDEAVGVCPTCDGSGEAEVTACCKELPGPGNCECVEDDGVPTKLVREMATLAAGRTP